MIDALSLGVESLAVSLGGGGGGGGGAAASGGEGGAALWLVSPYKPILTFIPFVAWAWVVATVYDKDAERFYLNRRAWNLAHLGVGVVALGAALFAPIFWIGWPIMLILLAVDLGVYVIYRNKSEKVPEHQKWSLNLEDIKKRREQRDAQRRRASVSLEFRGPNGLIEAPEKDSVEYELRASAEEIIQDAIAARAGRVELIPAKDPGTHQIVFIVDGVKQLGNTIASQQASAIIDFYKGASGLDVEDRRRRQRADLRMEREGSKRTLRIITQGGQGGQRMTILFDPEEQVQFKLENLGLLEPQMKEMQSIIKERKGAVLVCAPAMNGRTSTLYALVRAHDPYTSNVQTVEREAQASIEGVRHNIYDPMKESGEYATLARSILRRDPDVVAIAELPDPATAVEVAKADHDRIRTYVGVPAEGALVAIQAFLKAVGDNELAANALHGVTAQRLVRRLCQNCRVEYQPQPELLRKLGVGADKVQKLYKKGGQVLIKNKPETCPMCGGSGYLGQEGVFEVYRLEQEERGLIRAGDLMGLRAALRKKRLPSLQEAAVYKAVQGVTSVEEAARVTSGGSRPQQKRGAPSEKPAPAQG